MADNLGKQFEIRFKQDFLKLGNCSFDRLYDPGFGYKGIQNICDAICYKYPYHFHLEIKSKKGNTFPLINLKQYDKLIDKKNQHITGERIGVILWFIDHDTILFIPISTFEKIKNNGLKSFNIKMVGDNNYPNIIIPSIKKRVFMESDYSILMQLEDNNGQ